MRRASGRTAWAHVLEARGDATPAAATPASAARTPAVPRRRAPRTTLGTLTAALAHREAVDASIPLRQEFEILPVPKPRMTAADRWKKRPCVLRYRAYCDELRLRGARIPSRYRLVFVMPMPASWPESWRERMDGKPHLPRPDASNLAKAVEDALEPRDETLHCMAADKIWGRRALLIIEKT